MKILFIVPYAPNPVRVRPWQFIRALLARGNEITLASLWTSPQELDDLRALQAAGVTLLAQPMTSLHSLLAMARHLPSGAPLQASWSWNPALMADIRAVLQREQFDAVHVEHLRGSRYAFAVQELLRKDSAQGARPPVVWDSVDSISALFTQAQALNKGWKARLMTALDLQRTRRFEGRAAAAFPRTLVTSALDRDALLELAQAQGAETAARARAVIEVIANGVDLNAFACAPQEGRAAARIVFSGKMSYHANAAAARFLVQEIMPLVWQARPEGNGNHSDVELWLVGKDPGAEMRAWQEQSAGRITVTGAVPDMGALIGAATVAAAPLLYGAGIQNKVLEAMACGTPVVATPRATAALQAVHGTDLLVAEGAPALAAAIVRLLDEPALRASIARAGRTFVEQHHSWDAAAAYLEQVYRDAGEQTTS